LGVVVAIEAVFEENERLVPLEELSEESLGELRLREPEALRQLERSLRRHGQLEPLVVFRRQQVFELLDGFKRLQVARELDWHELRVRVAIVDAVGAKVLLLELHGRRGLTSLEEAWLVRALYREHGMSQGNIGARLGRHKSWVCRRLLLAEQLDPVVQADVRLGLLSARAALALVVLPRGNQKRAADVAVRRGMTVRQTALLVADLSDCDPSALEQRLFDWAEGKRSNAPAQPRKARSEADWLVHDINTLRNVGARLEARLLATPSSAFPQGVDEIILRGLLGLLPVLDALANTMRSQLSVNDALDDTPTRQALTQVAT
jgi:ParB family transcriptional regulator, chromosome partitioning protein